MPEYTLMQTAPPVWVALILFVILVLTFILGHRIRIRMAKRNPETEKVELSTINGMLLGLLGLLLAFSFSMSNSRFDMRRELIVEEANDIGTVVLRTYVLPDSVGVPIRESLRLYVEERIAFYESRANFRNAALHYLRADSLSQKIWSAVARQARLDNISVRTSEIIPALNAMIDITTTRRAAGEGTIPDSILYFLFVLCITSSFLIGYDNKGPIHWIVVVGFAAMLSATVFTIIDLDRPRTGIINMDGPQQRMVDLRGMFVK